MKMKFFLVAMVLILFFGCAATDQRVKKINNPAYSTNQELDFLMEPIDGIGILETPALLKHAKDGKGVSYYEFPFPELLYLGEVFPGKVKWFAWVVTLDGKEFPAQILYIYKYSLTGQLIGGLQVDGTREELRGAQAIGLSDRFERAFSLNRDESSIAINRASFSDNPDYRIKITRENGVLLDRLPKADYLFNIINKWNRYETKRGFILSPLSSERFEEVLAINPGYSYTQKLAKQSYVVSPDPIGMGVENLFILVQAYNLPPQGWSLGSKARTREYDALVRKHFFDIKQDVINRLSVMVKTQEILKEER